MKQTIVNELATFQERLKAAKGFRVVVHLKSGGVIDGSNVPISAFGEYSEECALIQEGAGLPLWDREMGIVSFVPASSINYVQFILIDK